MRGLPKEIEDCLYEFTNDLMSAMHDLAGPGAMRQADASKAELRSAISGELARQRDMTKDALDALARVEKERDRWRETALTIQTNLAESHANEKRSEWLRGHTEAFEDAATAFEAKLGAAESESARLREEMRSLIGMRARIEIFAEEWQRDADEWRGMANRKNAEAQERPAASVFEADYHGRSCTSRDHAKALRNLLAPSPEGGEGGGK